MKKNYKPKLLGIKNIGIMCSPRRISSNWELSIKKFIENLPPQSVIKLHPEFYVKSELQERFSNYLELLDINKKITICSNSVILEAEMLFEKKRFYGPLTSLCEYAKLFESDFVKIKIY